MAKTYRLSNYARNKCLVGGLLTEYTNGYRRIYDGTRPATPDDPLAGNTLLGELGFDPTDAWQDPVNGVAIANSMTPEDAALATGDATFFRDFAADGTTVLGDGEVGTSGSNMNINNGLGTTTITAGKPIYPSGTITLTMPMQEC